MKSKLSRAENDDFGASPQRHQHYQSLSENQAALK